MLDGVVNWLLPPLCPATEKPVDEQGMVDSDYWGRLTFISAPQCDICGLPFESARAGRNACGPCMAHPPPFDRARASLAYDEHSRILLLRFKHADHMAAGTPLARWMENAGEEFWDGCEAIVPVPLHWRRLMKRRYNQAAELGRALSHRVGLEFWGSALRRRRHTPVQGHLSPRARSRNVRGAFTVPESWAARVRDARLVLLDDVYTTGATVKACAQALRKAGAAEICVLTAARVLRSGDPEG